jgi:DNA-binding HxlR family transcriptional regulator
MRKKPPASRRSGCPLNASLEMVGDRWSLLIVRDMMLRGATSFADFLNSHEGIASNILTDRLHKLTEDGIIESAQDVSDGRKKIYRLTEKGIALAPTLTELVLWASAHEITGQQTLVRQMRDRARFLKTVRARWRAGSRRTVAGS